MKLLPSVLAGVLTLVSASAASAQEPAEPGKVPLYVDLEGSLRVQSRDFTTSCRGPCVLQLPAGYYTASTADLSKEIFVDRPTHVGVTRGSPAATTVSWVLLISGALVAVASVAIPVFACRSTRDVDSFGRVIDHNPCRDISDGVKVAWIAGGGAGLTLGIVGGIGLALSGPRLALSF